MQDNKAIFILVMYYAVDYVVGKNNDFKLVYDEFVLGKKINKEIAYLDYYQSNYHRYKRKVLYRLKQIEDNLKFLEDIYHKLTD